MRFRRLSPPSRVTMPKSFNMTTGATYGCLTYPASLASARTLGGSWNSRFTGSFTRRRRMDSSPSNSAVKRNRTPEDPSQIMIVRVSGEPCTDPVRRSQIKSAGSSEAIDRRPFWGAVAKRTTKASAVDGGAVGVRMSRHMRQCSRGQRRIRGTAPEDRLPLVRQGMFGIAFAQPRICENGER